MSRQPTILDIRYIHECAKNGDTLEQMAAWSGFSTHQCRKMLGMDRERALTLCGRSSEIGATPIRRSAPPLPMPGLGARERRSAAG